MSMNIIAEALINNRNYKSARINGEFVGVENARAWQSAVKACLIPAYQVRKARYDAMSNAADNKAVNQSALYDVIRPVIALIGEVNGATLSAKNVAEEFIAASVKVRVIDLTPEMAHAHCERKSAKKALQEDECPENQKVFDDWDIECKRLESIAGNCKRVFEIVKESTFVSVIEIVLGDAINKQSLRSVEDILAEREALKKARAEKRKANKKSK